MARVDESQQDLEDRIDRMEAKMKGGRGGIGCMKYFVYIIILLIILLGIGSYFMSKAGFVDIPILSAQVFEAPQPRYKIDITQITDDQDSLVQEVLRQAQKDFDTGKKEGAATITFTEGYVTALLHELVAQKASEEGGYEILQATVQGETVEVFLKRDKLYVTFEFRPYFDEKLRFETISLKVGQIQLPRFLGTLVLKLFVGSIFNTLESSISSFGEVAQILVIPGGIEIDLLVSSNAKIFNVFKK